MTGAPRSRRRAARYSSGRSWTSRSPIIVSRNVLGAHASGSRRSIFPASRTRPATGRTPSSRPARCTTSRLIDSTGRAFSVEAAELPGGKGDGVPLTSFVELAPGARLAHVVDAQPGRRYLVANSGGYGFIAKTEELLTRVRAGKAFMTHRGRRRSDPPGAAVPNEVPDKSEMAVALLGEGPHAAVPGGGAERARARPGHYADGPGRWRETRRGGLRRCEFGHRRRHIALRQGDDRAR